jgi:ferric enterobactin receptor
MAVRNPANMPRSRNEVGSLATNEVGAYTVAAVGVNYDLTKDLRLNAGISNLFDKQLYRENQGASTYNEPGRAYYAGMTLSF